MLSGLEQLSLHQSAAAAQSTFKHHSWISKGSSIQEKLWGSYNQLGTWKWHEIKTPPEVLCWHFSLWSHDICWPWKIGKVIQYHTGVCWVVFIPSANVMCSLWKRDMPLILPQKYQLSVLSKISSHMSASAKTYFHKSVSRKTSHETTESPKKQEISTSFLFLVITWNNATTMHFMSILILCVWGHVCFTIFESKGSVWHFRW